MQYLRDKHRTEIEKSTKFVQENSIAIKNHPLRQHYHFEVPYGWCNDPNGVVFFKGQYHLFYQHYPYQATCGAFKTYWGHAVSNDLLNWEHKKIALAPTDDFDNGGCWSGSAVELDGELLLFYTGISSKNNNAQVQCLARSSDGIHFIKSEKNPILSIPMCDADALDFRDPKVWKYGDHWYMVVGSAKEGLGTVLLYKSTDLNSWKFVNYLVESFGELGTVCECPDFFELDGKYVLLCSLKGMGQRKTIYLVGDFDYHVGRLFWSTYGEIDWGMDYYAPQTFLDGHNRRIMIAWANAWDWMPWFGNGYYTSQFGWSGGMALIRSLSLAEDNRLRCTPIQELKTLRNSRKVLENIGLENGKVINLFASDNPCCELLFDIHVKNTLKQEEQKIILEFTENKSTVIICDIKKCELVFHRGLTSKKCPLKLVDTHLKLHLFIDTTSVELFTDDDCTSMSNNVYDLGATLKINMKAVGEGFHLHKLDCFPISAPNAGSLG